MTPTTTPQNNHTSLSDFRKARNGPSVSFLTDRVQSVFMGKNGTYNGEMIDGKREGKGIFSWNEGNSYKGEWQRDLRHGHGIETHKKNGKLVELYEGNWVDDQRQGEGYFVSTDNYQYEGNWVENLPNGKGKWTCFKSDESYEGDFKDGKGTGSGTYSFKREQIEFVGTLQHDGSIRGTYTFPSGFQQEGVFQKPPPKPQAPDPL